MQAKYGESFRTDNENSRRDGRRRFPVIIQSAEGDVNVDYDELATLKHLARKDALTQEIKVSGRTLADELDISTQTASRRLKSLADAGFIYRQPINDGQFVFIREEGKRVIQKEYKEYRQIFERLSELVFAGEIVDGMGEGKHYLSLDGYQNQFVQELGYEPFPGTLNVQLTTESMARRGRLSDIDPIRIDEWEDEERTYGAVFCYLGRLEAETASYDPIHVIKPERTHYDDGYLELIAADKLRAGLDIQTGDHVTIHLHK